eukprot:CAMPEP_0119108890 /NCGR_PEP_ID=MMETSP1180-20130426/16009_1 /TAXON_ID=3052 ORGANISM="Chlamydomonas cf sp, Strain CCMP681" /NCGR_SAMPLE_ID=MMETSP1180 /ASSEMBLY_ACC=CAM_ASM_000741 /LENGTH=379 /DNA_ID=CAMNT_0007094565 /DNA_START=8 /DNA_END=1147 /DNA_ORIENTATION=-
MMGQQHGALGMRQQQQRNGMSPAGLALCPTHVLRPVHSMCQQPAQRHTRRQGLEAVAGHSEPVAMQSALTPQDEQPIASTSGTDDVDRSINTSNLWEIDFCSRPMVDERGKKVWELLICDSSRSFEYSEYFANSKINSAELRRAVEAILARPGAVRPEKARFFRSQMQTIITKALTECGIKPVPSRRCFTVMSWIQERMESVYKLDPRYSDKSQSLFSLDLGPPEALPDALRGEQWAFVQLPLRQLQTMLKGVEEADIFGNTFDLATIGADTLPKDILIPGVAVFSRRALPLAAWTNGLEIAAVKADVLRSSLILETGVNQRWKYGGWKPNQDAIDEAENWEDCKQGVKGLHFLAVQPNPDSEDLTGLWLLSDREPPQV